MLEAPDEEHTRSGYALALADGSYEWYRRAAIKARRFYRLTETLQLIVATTIPISTVLLPGYVGIPAVLGGVIVVLTGLRSIFHWQDDYLRFSEAREAVEAERRLYITRAKPYDGQSRDQILAAAVTRIEQQEMGRWKEIASRQKTESAGSP